MSKKIILLALLILPLFLSSCFFSPSINGNGNVVEDERKADDFDEIKVSRGMNVHISTGDDFRVVVKADENLLDAIVTSVEGDRLVVTVIKNIRHATAKDVYVTLPELEEINAFAGSNVYSENTITVGDLDISASAGSNVKLSVKADEINASASAGSNISLEGNTDYLDARASAGSNIRAEEMKASESDLKVSSGANIWITTTTRMDARASSGGNIFYAGDPDKTNISKSSGGNVIKR